LAVLTTSDNSEIIKTAAEANWWKFQCLAFSADGTTERFALVLVGDTQETGTDEDDAAYRIHFDRIVLPNQTMGELKAFIRVGLMTDFSITRSWLGDVLDLFLDTQVISVRNSRCMSCVIDDNYIGAASESVLIGGAAPFVTNLNADGVIITDNTFFRDTAFFVSHETETGGDIGVHKHHIEVKHGGLNGTIARNVFWNNWWGPSHGTGPSVYLSPRGESCPGCEVSHWTIENNVFYNVSQCYQVAGIDSDGFDTQETIDVIFRNNVCEYTYNCVLYNFSPDGLVFSNNTCVLQSGSPGGTPNGWMVWSDAQDPLTDEFELNNNIVLSGQYGLFGGGPPGEATLDAMVIDWTMTGNVIAGVEDYGNIGEEDYPDGQTFITSETLETIFTNFAGRVYCVDPMSVYYGKGADCSQIPSLTTATTKRIPFRIIRVSEE
jgi:hypothetical protein